MPSADATLTLTGLSKSYGPTKALQNVSLTFQRGEVHGIVGENGAGKSTLIKLLTGLIMPDAGGTISVSGHPPTGRKSRRTGIGVVHQDLGLVDSLTVLENLEVHRHYGATSFGPIRWRRQARAAAVHLERLGMELRLDQPVTTLSSIDRANLAIARALWAVSEAESDPILLLDEPTVYLPRDGVHQLLDVVRSIADRGGTVIYVSHYLRDVLAVCDRITVLRDGQVVSTDPANALTLSVIVERMIGRDIGQFYPSHVDVDEESSVALEVKSLSGKSVRDVSFKVYAGEILGITGLVGMGQDELPRLIFGAARRSGEVLLEDGKSLRAGLKKAAVDGVVLLPASRAREGLWLGASAVENATLPVLRSYFKKGRLRNAVAKADVRAMMERMDVRPVEPERLGAAFSGGNQQKLMLGRCLDMRPKVLILEEPTQGVDAGARKQILEKISEAARAGAGVILVSADLEQLAYTCDRVLIMHSGKIAGVLGRRELSEEVILAACNSFEDAHSVERMALRSGSD